MARIRYVKVEATGNDFLVQDLLTGAAPPTAAQAVALCDRHRGIGADGLLTLGPGPVGVDCTMRLLNADGSEAEMSGNGIRALAWLAHGLGLGTETALVVDTAAGRRTVELDVDDSTDTVRGATVDMGAVTFDPAEIPLDASSAFDLDAVYHGVTYSGDAAGMGNPHLVLLVDDPATARVHQHGPHLERDRRFPRRTNVEFVALTPGEPDTITMRVWERGVGETLSCGTGACAAAAVAHRRGLVGGHVTVQVPGGRLRVELGSTIRLGGPVREVFATEVDPDELVEARR